MYNYIYILDPLSPVDSLIGMQWATEVFVAFEKGGGRGVAHSFNCTPALPTHLFNSSLVVTWSVLLRGALVIASLRQSRVLLILAWGSVAL